MSETDKEKADGPKEPMVIFIDPGKDIDFDSDRFLIGGSDRPYGGRLVEVDGE